MPKKLTQAEFLAKAVAVHGVGRYDYSQALYINNSTKVDILCSIHGLFQQKPNGHIDSRQGCPACGINSLKSDFDLQAFIPKARKIHGDKYTYLGAVRNDKGRVMLHIECPLHGHFSQYAHSHRGQAQGCPRCAGLAPLSTDDFIKRARAIHGDKYDYSESKYLNDRAKIAIKCPHHGVFYQVNAAHTRLKQGCPKCGVERRAKSRLLLKDDFIKRARAIHSYTYDYSRVNNLKSARAKVSISCIYHGPFYQAPAKHMAGQGCPICGQERTAAAGRLDWIERAAGHKATLYFIRLFSSEESFYKVGITYLSIRERYSRPRSLGNYQYEVLAQYHSDNATVVYDWEQSILATFTHLAYRPKKPFEGASECFSSAEEILTIFPL